jgi:hypothetical protein
MLKYLMAGCGLAVLLVFGCSSPPVESGSTLLSTRCASCHSSDRGTNAKKTRDQWDQAVTRMMSKGAQLNDAEKTVLINYLANR